jgi:plasmid maintenance system killer protein
MKIKYKSNKLEKQLSNPKEITKKFGTRARKVNQRMQELKAVDSLFEMKSIPVANCHELSENRQDEIAVDISANFRMIFIPDHDPLPLKEDGGLNWEKVTDIKIVKMEDYH